MANRAVLIGDDNSLPPVVKVVESNLPPRLQEAALAAQINDAVVPGPEGPAGSSATVDVGTTTTGTPGTSAEVIAGGTSSARVLDFVIPRGETGPQGLQGIRGPGGGNNLLNDGQFDLDITSPESPFAEAQNATTTWSNDGANAMFSPGYITTTILDTAASGAIDPSVHFKPLPVETSRTYRLSAWVKAGTTLTSVQKIQWFGHIERTDGTTLTISKGPLITLSTSSFTRVTYDYTIPSTTPAIYRLYPRLSSSDRNAGDIFYIDSVMVTDITDVYESFNGMRLKALTDAATIVWNITNTDLCTVTLGGNRTIGVPTGLFNDGKEITLRVKQDATGGRTLTLSGYRTSSVDATLQTTPNATDLLTFQYDKVSNKWGLVRKVSWGV